MVRIRAVIIDDEIKSARLLAHLLGEYCPDVQIIGQAGNIKDGVALIQREKPDVVFLDIVLKEGTSFDILDEISMEQIKVVFVTGHEDYAVRAFQYNALDYILKPIKINTLQQTVERIKEEIYNNRYTDRRQVDHLLEFLRSGKQEFIGIPTLHTLEFIYLNMTLYLKSDGRYTTFYIYGRSPIISSKNLGHYEECLDPRSFFRIHKSYIINLNCIKSIGKTENGMCTLIDGTEIPIARTRRAQLLKMIRI